MFLAIKNFPAPLLAAVPFAEVARYVWHVVYLLNGQGKAAEFAKGDGATKLAWFVLRAHAAAFMALPALLAKRRRVQDQATISAAEFRRVLRAHSIPVRQVASH